MKMKPTSMHGLRALFVLATALALIAPAGAADYCKLYLHTNQGTELFNAQLAASDTYTPLSPFGEPWSSSSVRFTGPEMKSIKGSTWWQASSAKILAEDSDIYLYLFTGEHFDGSLSAARCPKGETCLVDFVSRNMNDKVKSFICQRDFPELILPPYRVPTGHAQDDGSIDIVEIPTAAFVSEIRAAFLAKVGPATGGGFYGPRETQVSWTTLEQACDLIDGLYSVDVWTWYDAHHSLCTHIDATSKYKDLLYIRHSFDLVGCKTILGIKFCESGTPTVHMWTRPVLEGGKLVFRSDWQHDNGYFAVVTPEENDISGTLTSVIWNKVYEQFNGGKDDLGPTLTDALYDEVATSVCCSQSTPCNLDGKCGQHATCNAIQETVCDYLAETLVLGSKTRLQLTYSWFPLHDYNPTWTYPAVTTPSSAYWAMEAFYPVPVRSMTPVIRLNQHRAFLPTDDREDDDTAAAAKNFTAGDTLTLTCTDDDWSKFQRSVGNDPIDVHVDFFHSAGDLDVALYNPDGTLAALGTSTTDDEIIYHLPTQTGTYKLVVYGYAGATNKYELFVQ